MNSVVSDPRTSQFRDPLVKHVIMEKSVHECFETGGPEERRFIRDQEIFIEIIQRVQAGRTTTVEKRIEETVCDKTLEPGTFNSLAIECSTRDIPVPEIPTERDIQCRAFTPEEFPQPTDPVEMNTVITARQDTVITMKVEKEILSCPTDGFNGFGDLFLITEIVEQRAVAAGADSIRPTEKKFQAILCLAPIFTGQVQECGHFAPTTPPPA